MGILDFELFNAKHMLQQLGDDPERLFLGAADPLSSKLWGGILGKDYEPIIDQWGGAAPGSYEAAEKAGINTKDAKAAHQVAQMVAAMYAGNYGMKALGGMGGASSSGLSESASGMTEGSVGSNSNLLGGLSGSEGAGGDAITNSAKLLQRQGANGGGVTWWDKLQGMGHKMAGSSGQMPSMGGMGGGQQREEPTMQAPSYRPPPIDLSSLLALRRRLGLLDEGYY
jgi:hypothetical protein